LYRQRWQVELFFRWFKKVLEADHLLSLSENGLTLVMYCALIASMLVTLWTGRKPTKRTFEMLCFYLTGWASEETLLAHLAKLPPLKKLN
jgi:IS4 transposase